jgi:hypothetical protein
MAVAPGAGRGTHSDRAVAAPAAAPATLGILLPLPPPPPRSSWASCSSRVRKSAAGGCSAAEAAAAAASAARAMTRCHRAMASLTLTALPGAVGAAAASARAVAALVVAGGVEAVAGARLAVGIAVPPTAAGPKAAGRCPVPCAPLTPSAQPSLPPTLHGSSGGGTHAPPTLGAFVRAGTADHDLSLQGGHEGQASKQASHSLALSGSLLLHHQALKGHAAENGVSLPCQLSRAVVATSM